MIKMKILAIVNGKKKYKTNDNRPRKYHIWKNNDTKCKMYLTGGLGDIKNIKINKIKVKDSDFNKMRREGKICTNCVSYSNRNVENNNKEITRESKEFLWEELYEGE